MLKQNFSDSDSCWASLSTSKTLSTLSRSMNLHVVQFYPYLPLLPSIPPSLPVSPFRRWLICSLVVVNLVPLVAAEVPVSPHVSSGTLYPSLVQPSMKLRYRIVRHSYYTSCMECMDELGIIKSLMHDDTECVWRYVLYRNVTILGFLPSRGCMPSTPLYTCESVESYVCFEWSFTPFFNCHLAV